MGQEIKRRCKRPYSHDEANKSVFGKKKRQDPKRGRDKKQKQKNTQKKRRDGKGTLTPPKKRKGWEGVKDSKNTHD